METWRRELYLAHHGIKGQKWGVRRGPPYPLDAHSRSTGCNKSFDKLAGRLDNRVEKSYATSRKLSKAVKVGAIAAFAGLAAYGAYKSGAFKNFRSLGEQAVKETLKEFGSAPAGSLGDSKPTFAPQSPPSPSTKLKGKPIIRDPKTGFKLISEPLSESLKNANPMKGKPEYDGNCTCSAVAGFLRTQGYDVTAKGTFGKGQDLGGILEKVFKGVDLKEGAGGAIPRSPDDAAKMLRKRFGDNASGAIMLTWNKADAGSHAFNWTIRNGVVEFVDFQNNNDNSVCRNYWNLADHNGPFLFARLDADKYGNKLEINLDAVRDYVEER